MPEGDTIYRLARLLRTELVGTKTLNAHFRDRGTINALKNQKIISVESRGKHLIITFDGGWSLRSHMGIHGDLHRYQQGEPWRRDHSKGVFVLETDAKSTYVWFEPAQAELVRTALLHADPQLARQGPDLLGPDFQLDEVVQRARALTQARGKNYTVGELLMDQSVAGGIGNVYKSELLFIHKLHPWTPAHLIDETTVQKIYSCARELLLKNRAPGHRVTRTGSGPRGEFLPGEPSLWVYNRAGLPCLRCGALIKVKKLGPQARGTFYCPQCQLSSTAHVER